MMSGDSFAIEFEILSHDVGAIENSGESNRSTVRN